MKTYSENIGGWALGIILKILKYAGLTLAGIVGLLVIMSVTGIALPLNFLKGTIESAAFSATGRTLAIDGGIGVVPGLSPVAKVAGIRLSNPQSWGGTDMVAIEQVEAEVHLLALLGSKIHLGNILVSGVNVNLVKDISGQPNWLFDPAESRDESVSAENPGEPDSSGPGMTLQAVDGVYLNDVSVTYEDKVTGKAIDIVIQSSVFTAAESQPVSLELDAILSGLPLELDISAPQLVEIMEFKFPMHIDLTAALGGLNMEAGLDVNSIADINVSTRIFGDDLGETGRKLGIALPEVSTYNLSTLLKVEGSDISLTDLTIVLDQNNISGNLKVSKADDQISVSGQVDIVYLDIDSLVTGDEDDDEGKETTDNQADSGDQGLSGLGRQLSKYHVDLGISIGELNLGSANIRDSTIQASLDQGVLETPITLNLNAIPMEGMLTLSATETGVSAQVSLQVDNNDIGDLEHLLNLEGIDGSLGRFSINADSTGDTVKELVASLETRHSIEGAKLQYGRGENAEPVDFSIDNLVAILTSGESLTLDAQGSLLGEAFEIDLDGGNPGRLIKGKGWPVNVVATGSGAKLEIKGEVARAVADSGSQLDISVSSERIGDLSAWTGINPGTDAGVTFSVQASTSKSGWSLSNLQLELGESLLEGEISANTGDLGRVLAISLSSPILDIEELSALAPEPDEEIAATAESNDQQQQEIAISDAIKSGLEMPILPKSIVLPDADIDIDLSELKLASHSIRDIHFGGSIRNGILEPSPFGMRFGGAVFTGEISFDSVSSPPTSHLLVEARDIDLGHLLSEFQFSDDITASASLLGLEINLTGMRLGKILENSTIKVEISEGEWILADPARGSELPLVVKQGELSIDPGQPLTVTLDVFLRNEPLFIQITADRPAIPGQFESLDLEIQVDYLDNKLVFSGVTPLPIELEIVELALDMSGESLASLTPVVGLRLPDIGPYTLAGEFKMNQRGYFLDKLQTRVGSSILNGTAALKTALNVPEFDVKLVSNLTSSMISSPWAIWNPGQITQR